MWGRALLLGVAVSFWAGSALADPATCTTAAERGQKERASGKLIDAHRAFQECSAAECSAANDCATWAAEVLAATPTIVVDAKDEAGHDVGDATLTIDGAVVATQLDGKAIPVDTGPHTIDVMPNQGGSRVTHRFIAKEAEKARLIRLVVPAAPAAPAGSGASEASEHTVFPWIVVGIGAAVFVTGVVLHLTPRDLPLVSVAHSEAEADAIDARNARIQKQNHNQRVWGTAAIVAGSVTVVGGLLWHFLERPAPRTVMAPWYNVTSGGLEVHHVF